MNSRSRAMIVLVVTSAFLGTFPAKTAAQCGGGLLGLGAVSGMAGNPFQAEVKQTFLSDNPEVKRLMEPRHEQVARDSEGRLRTELSNGKYRVQNGPGAGTEEEQRHIIICDPVKGESITLDTLNKTATVSKLSFHGAPPKTLPNGAALPSFCSQQFRVPSHMPGANVQELGHRTIEGLDAVGVSEKRPLPSGFSSNGTTTTKQVTSVTEVWCSEELGAVVLRLIGTEERGNNQSFALVNIQHEEPDATLFQIPPDYRVVERVDEGKLGVLGTVGSSSHLVPVDPNSLPKP